VDLDPFGLALRRPFGAPVGVVADQFLLLGVHADHRLAVVGEGDGHVVQVAELGVTVGVLAALGDLGIGLQRVAQLVQQPQHRARRHLEAFAQQFRGQLGGGLRRPAQQRHRVAPGLGMDQLVQGFEQPGLLLGQRLVATAGSTQAVGGLHSRCHLCHRLDDGVAAHARRLRHRRLATTARQLRRRPGHHPALALIQVRQDHIEEPREPFGRDLHTVTVLRAY